MSRVSVFDWHRVLKKVGEMSMMLPRMAVVSPMKVFKRSVIWFVQIGESNDQELNINTGPDRF
jgi:hypothetical protein